MATTYCKHCNIYFFFGPGYYEPFDEVLCLLVAADAMILLPPLHVLNRTSHEITGLEGRLRAELPDYAS